MKILYYAHHHGSGHCKNAEHFYKILSDNLVIATSSNYEFKHNEQVVRLTSEKELPDDLLAGREMLPNYLHYSPIGNKNILERSYQLLKICNSKNIDLAVIDLSVEVATLMRVSSIPFAYVRLPGNRNDTAHIECFKAATFLFAYFPKELEDVNTPTWVIKKTIYFGFLFHEKPEVDVSHIPLEILSNKDSLVLVIKGFGGSREVDEAIPDLKLRLKDKFFLSIGPIDDNYRNYYDYIIDYTPDVYSYMSISTLIVAPASLNLSAEILSTHKPFIVIPSWRHFDEQKVMANNLVRCGYALTKTDEIKKPKKFQQNSRAEELLQNMKSSKNIRNFYTYLHEK